MLTSTTRLFTVLLLLALVSCGGGSGDNSDSPSTNACSTLGLNTRIINGSQCAETGSPVVALNILSQDGNGSLCSGTVITKTHIVTAAHCFLDQNVQSVFVEIDGQRIFASKVSIHPDAKVDNNRQSAVNDVAVLEMNRDLNRPTVPLLLSRSIESGDIIAIFGFGLDENGRIGELESGEMQVSDVTTNELIADFQGEGSNTCNGDSGGPALFTTSNSGRAALVGVTSSGTLNTCLAGDKSFFTNIQKGSILSFIQSVAIGVEGI
jgi:secreted trypsin-like serine protease